MLLTCATIEAASPTLAGITTVLLVLARFEKALTYSSATLRVAALSPNWNNIGGLVCKELVLLLRMAGKNINLPLLNQDFPISSIITYSILPLACEQLPGALAASRRLRAPGSRFAGYLSLPDLNWSLDLHLYGGHFAAVSVKMSILPYSLFIKGNDKTYFNLTASFWNYKCSCWNFDLMRSLESWKKGIALSKGQYWIAEWNIAEWNMENVFTHCAANWDHGKSHVTGKAGSFCNRCSRFWRRSVWRSFKWCVKEITILSTETQTNTVCKVSLRSRVKIWHFKCHQWLFESCLQGQFRKR